MLMVLRKLVTITLVLGAIGVGASASAQPTIAPRAAQPTIKKKVPFKLATRPQASLSATDVTKVRARIDNNLAVFLKDKNAIKFLDGGASLGGDMAVAYQQVASRMLSSSASGGGAGTGGVTASGANTPVQQSTTYAIEAGEVVSASFAQPCDGSLDLSFTIKNRGAKAMVGAPRLYGVLMRSDASQAIASAWVNVPLLDAGATTTVQLPALRHRAPGSGGACSTGDIVVIPTFIDVAAQAEYRLKIALTSTSADATLLSGIFAAPLANGGGGGGNDCGLLTKCPNGSCAMVCPPCPAPMWTESNGGCVYTGVGGLVLR